MIQELQEKVSDSIKQFEEAKGEVSKLSSDNSEIISMKKELEIERDSLRERVGKYEQIHTKMSSEHEQYAQYKQKW